MSTQRVLPSWLVSAYRDGYLRQALMVLAEREAARESARYASRQGLEGERPATTNRSSQQAATQQWGHVEPSRYSVAVGASKVNRHRNRYFELEPYDRTRVVVSPVGWVPDETSANNTLSLEQGDYLNASWVLERFGHKWWIASQAPLPQTAHTFLSVLLQPITRPPPLLSSVADSYPLSQTTQIRTVVQLTKDVEGGRRKAHPYFPSDVGKTVVISAEEKSDSPGLSVTLLNVEDIQDSHCIKSTISVVPLIDHPSRNAQAHSYMDIEEDADVKGVHGKPNFAPVIFTHLLYTSWPDHGVPEAEDRISLFKFLHLADCINRDTSLSSYPSENNIAYTNLDPDPPIIVGCSAGVGRTGSFIALSSLLRHLRELPSPSVPTPSSVLPPSLLGPLPEQFRDDLVAQEIDSLREQRQRMVERPEQVLLIYEMLVDLVGGS